MDYQRFIDQLPALYHNWGQESVQPQSDQFQAVLNHVQGMTTANVLQLLNFAVACLEPDEVYCEVGCFRGSTLIGALLNHPDRMAYAVDNFSEFDPQGENLEHLMQNLSAFHLEEQVLFCNQDFEAFFADWQALQMSDRIGVYFYDGAHDYRSQLMGLLLARPFLADRALIIVDDSNWEPVQQANWDFIAAHPQCSLVLDLPTAGNGDSTFWNGLQILSWDRQAKHTHPWSTLQPARKPMFIQALSSLSEQRVQPQQPAPSRESLRQEALRLQQAGLLAEAKQQYLSLLQQDDTDAEAWQGLGVVEYLLEEYENARSALSKAIDLNPDAARYYYSIALVFEKLDQIPLAARAYQQAIALDSSLLDAYNNLGNLVAEHGDLAQAERIFNQAIAADPDYLGSYLNLGNVLLVQAKVESAIAAYEIALAIDPTHVDGQANLSFARELAADPLQAHLFAADNLSRRHHYEPAASHYQTLLDQGRSELAIYIALTSCYQKLKQYEAVVTVCQQGMVHYPGEIELHQQLITALQESGHTETAIVQATQSALQFPDQWLFQLQKYLLLPCLYQTAEEVPIWRDRYAQGLTTLLEQTALTTSEQQKNALDAIGAFTNFFLICQPTNHRAVQQPFGQLVHQIMAANYPQWVQPLPLSTLHPGEKIRVGYVSGCLRGHTVGKLMLGWFREHDRERFQIHSYHVFDQEDALTQEFRNHSDAFYSIPDDIEAVCEQILADRPHILVFLEIGMQPLMTQLAALRLAPVQCTTWAHPITSGLPTVDYFLSSDLMEPAQAQDHYSEQLIRLPNIGICFAKPHVPAVTQPRAAFGLREDAVVYLACQTLCKYLPDQDAVFAAISQQVPNAQFVFVARPNAAIAAQFQQRLQQAFAVVGLDSEAHCIILPPQSQTDYWNLNQVADVFLDSFGWTGGHTTLEAITCDLPVVTLPGELMRGRHSDAILTMLGLTETIAQTTEDYIDLAVRLGCDPTWRADLVQRMRARQSHLYNDKTCVTALEAFYQQVVSSPVSSATE